MVELRFVFTSEWQEQPFDKDIVKGVKGYQDVKSFILKVKKHQR